MRYKKHDRISVSFHSEGSSGSLEVDVRHEQVISQASTTISRNNSNSFVMLTNRQV